MSTETRLDTVEHRLEELGSRLRQLEGAPAVEPQTRREVPTAARHPVAPIRRSEPSSAPLGGQGHRGALRGTCACLGRGPGDPARRRPLHGNGDQPRLARRAGAHDHRLPGVDGAGPRRGLAARAQGSARGRRRSGSQRDLGPLRHPAGRHPELRAHLGRPRPGDGGGDRRRRPGDRGPLVVDDGRRDRRPRRPRGAASRRRRNVGNVDRLRRRWRSRERSASWSGSAGTGWRWVPSSSRRRS